MTTPLGADRDNPLVLRRTRWTRRGPIVWLGAAGAIVALGAAGSAAATATTGPCGRATTATIAAVDAAVATNIYRNELAGTEVSWDLRNVTAARDLATALAHGNAAAVRKATQRIVYHPGWHIVRLRVSGRRGQVLADVGGPYVIAPVGGDLRWNGRIVGHFVMSVQDDVGITKLESRFVGDPIGIYVAGRLVAAAGGRLPASQPQGAALTLAGVRYVLVSETDRAFPNGSLTVIVLVAPAIAALEQRSCTAVRVGEFGRIATRLSHLGFVFPQRYPVYATSVLTYTGAQVFVRAGAVQIASSGAPGPPAIPSRGAVTYEGRRWLVFSFVALPPARVYLLVAPA